MTDALFGRKSRYTPHAPPKTMDTRVTRAAANAVHYWDFGNDALASSSRRDNRTVTRDRLSSFWAQNEVGGGTVVETSGAVNRTHFVLVPFFVGFRGRKTAIPSVVLCGWRRRELPLLLKLQLHRHCIPYEVLGLKSSSH